MMPAALHLSERPHRPLVSVADWYSIVGAVADLGRWEGLIHCVQVKFEQTKLHGEFHAVRYHVRYRFAWVSDTRPTLSEAIEAAGQIIEEIHSAVEWEGEGRGARSRALKLKGDRHDR